MSSEERFNTFWMAYPRKVGKGVARRVFEKLKVSEDLLHSMLIAISRQLESQEWKKNGGEFIPHPSTWLNQERWSDEGLRLPQKTPSDSPGSPIKKERIPWGYKTWLEYEKAHTEPIEKLLEAIRENPEKFRWFVLPFIKICPTSIRGEVETIYRIVGPIEESSELCPY